MTDFAPRNQMILAQNASVTDTGVVWPGGAGLFSAEGTFGAGSVSLQMRSGNGTWIAVGTATTLLANGVAGFILPKGVQIRAAIVTATAVYSYVVPF